MTSLDFYDEIESRFKYILCFLPNVGLLFSLKIIFQYERSGKLKNILDSISQSVLNCFYYF